MDPSTIRDIKVDWGIFLFKFFFFNQQFLNFHLSGEYKVSKHPVKVWMVWCELW